MSGFLTGPLFSLDLGLWPCWQVVSLFFLPVHWPRISVNVSCTEKQPSALHPNNAHICISLHSLNCLNKQRIPPLPSATVRTGSGRAGCAEVVSRCRPAPSCSTITVTLCRRNVATQWLEHAMCFLTNSYLPFSA